MTNEHLILVGGATGTEACVTLGVLAAHGPCPRGAYEAGMGCDEFFGSIDEPGEVAKAHGGVLTAPIDLPAPWLELLGGLMGDGELVVREGGRERAWPTRFRLVMNAPAGADVEALVAPWWPQGQRFGILDLGDFERLLATLST